MPRGLHARTLLITALAGLLLWFGVTRQNAAPEPAASSAKAHADAPSAYAGSEACRACHEKQFQSWQSSHHARAERTFDPAADAERLARASAKAGSAARPVRWIGVEPLEQVLFELPGGRLQALDVAHDPRSGEWFGIFGDEQRRQGDWGHWTGRGMNWNASCAYCHNTGVHKGYEPERDTYQTTFAELGVGCESCHGPSRAHVQTPNRAPSAPAPERQRDVCAACHARRAQLTEAFVAGERFDDHFVLELPDESDVFYADGQVRDEAYEVSAFVGSRMAHGGVTCADCHDSHSSRTRASGNALCLNCHAGGLRGAPVVDAARHSFHAAGSTGDACVNCHMPETTYMQRHARRDHGFTIPDPQLTVERGVPNACTRCHSEKPAGWAVKALRARYGPGSERSVKAHERADAVARARVGEPGAARALLELLRHEPVASWRAVAADLLEGYLAEPEVVPALLAASSDAESLVRSHALRTLELAQDAKDPRVSAALRRGLDDPVRSVRVAAAWALRQSVTEDSRAGRDLASYLALAADQPLGQLQLGHYALARGQTQAAVRHFQRAVEWDSGSAPLRHELAVALSRVGRSHDAVRELEQAVRLEPRSAEFSFALGLARNESGDLPGAINALERAVELDPTFERARHNLKQVRARQRRPHL